jgi:hypothetical protein
MSNVTPRYRRIVAPLDGSRVRGSRKAKARGLMRARSVNEVLRRSGHRRRLAPAQTVFREAATETLP